MRYLVNEVDAENRCFYCMIDGRKEGFYLPNRLAKVFLPHLEHGIIVEFAVVEKRKKHLNRYMYQVSHFMFVAQTNPYRIIYDLEALRGHMRHVLKQYEYFLFLDSEMTMPQYGQKDFVAEMIQVGYVLSHKTGKVLLEAGYYIKTKDRNPLNKRTKKFLNLDEEVYEKEALSYDDFYQEFKKILNAYKAPIVIWGKNDLQVIQQGYQLHGKEPLTHEKQFIDLLKLHKDYFNLKDDVGLFKAYQIYYGQLNETQLHDAKTDAIITKDIFDAFIKQML